MSGRLATWTDDDLRELSPRARARLIAALRSLDAPPPPMSIPQRTRRVRLGTMTFATLAMIPWTVYLAVSLPMHYTTDTWALTWVGFDTLLVLCMATTAYFAWRRRQVLVVSSFATAVLLVCDAWFDLTTAASGDRWTAVASAAFLELPLAGLLALGSTRILRVTARHQAKLAEGARLIDLPLFGSYSESQSAEATAITRDDRRSDRA